jgi:hypothetical protein
VHHVATPRAAALLLALILVPFPGSHVSEPQGKLAPTAHPALPGDLSGFWLVPSAKERVSAAGTRYQPLVEAVKAFEKGEYDRAAELASRPALAKTPLAGHAAYYRGLSQLRQLQTEQARKTLEDLLAGGPSGALAISVAMAAGEAAETATDHRAALAIYEKLAADKVAVSDEVLARLGRTALAAGDRKKAAEAYVRLFYEYPLTTAGATAASSMKSLEDQWTRRGYDADIGRAQMFFGARRWAEAKAAFEEIRPNVGGDDRELVDLRIAESDYYLGNLY